MLLFAVQLLGGAPSAVWLSEDDVAGRIRRLTGGDDVQYPKALLPRTQLLEAHFNFMCALDSSCAVATLGADTSALLAQFATRRDWTGNAVGTLHLGSGLFRDQVPPAAVNDGAMRAIAQHFPGLRILRLTGPGDDPDQDPRHAFTSAGVDAVASSCRGLEVLDVGGSTGLESLPPSLAKLQRLVELRCVWGGASELSPFLSVRNLLGRHCSFASPRLPAPLKWLAKFQHGMQLVESVRVYIRQSESGRTPFNVVKVPVSVHDRHVYRLAMMLVVCCAPRCSWLGESAKEKAASWTRCATVVRCCPPIDGPSPGCLLASSELALTALTFCK